jgi:hypothetical protein
MCHSGQFGAKTGHAVSLVNAHFGERMRETRNPAKHFARRNVHPAIAELVNLHARVG